MTDYPDKFVAFVDILGFKSLVNGGASPDEIIEILKRFGNAGVRELLARQGSSVCPDAPWVRRDPDFRSQQVSDSLIASAEVSPAGAINIINFCWESVLGCLQRGILCRGYVNRGPAHHSDDHLFGPAFQEAVEREKVVAAFRREADEIGTPYVEVAPSVVRYVDQCGDPCVQRMFSRLVRRDGQLVAIYPFQRLRHSFMIGPAGFSSFDAQKELRSVNNLRTWIRNFMERVNSHIDASKPDAVRKARHYLSALQEELEMCDRTEGIIKRLDSPLGGRW